MINFFRINQDFQLSQFQIAYIFDLQNILLSVPDIINFLYIIAMFSLILWSTMTNHNNSRFKVIYYGSSTLIGLYGILVFALLFYNTYSIIRQTFNDSTEP